MTPPRRFFIETWGCQMNELDTQRMVGPAHAAGMLPTREPGGGGPHPPQLLQRAGEGGAEGLLAARASTGCSSATRGELLIGLCGCVAQQEGERALERVPDLDFVLGPARVGELQDVHARRRAGERVVATGFPQDRQYDIDAVARHGEYKGMVTIIEGCNKNCTFCIVPQTRGPERSRPLRRDPARGPPPPRLRLRRRSSCWARPSTTGASPAGDSDFADLLDRGRRACRACSGCASSPPTRATSRRGWWSRWAKHAEHLPLPAPARAVRLRPRAAPHGARLHAAASTSTSSAQLRRARPGPRALDRPHRRLSRGDRGGLRAAPSSWCDEVRFAALFAFKYSPRPGTAAPRLDGAVDPEVAAERLQRLFAAPGRRSSARSTQALVGQRVRGHRDRLGEAAGHPDRPHPLPSRRPLRDRRRAGRPGRHHPRRVETAFAAQPAASCRRASTVAVLDQPRRTFVLDLAPLRAPRIGHERPQRRAPGGDQGADAGPLVERPHRHPAGHREPALPAHLDRRLRGQRHRAAHRGGRAPAADDPRPAALAARAARRPGGEDRDLRPAGEHLLRPDPCPHAASAALEVDARPSDAIALALRTGSPIFVCAPCSTRRRRSTSRPRPTDEEKLKKWLEEISPDELGKYTM